MMASRHSTAPEEGQNRLPPHLRQQLQSWIETNYEELKARSYPGNRKPNENRSAFDERITIRLDTALKEDIEALIDCDSVAVPSRSEAGRLGLILLCNAFTDVLQSHPQGADSELHLELPVPDGTHVQNEPVESVTVYTDRVEIVYADSETGAEQRIIFGATVVNGDATITRVPPGFPDPANPQDGALESEPALYDYLRSIGIGFAES